MKNGWTMWLAGIIATALTTAMFTLGNAVVTNDRDARSRDEKIQEKAVVTAEKTESSISDIKVMLASMQSDIKYIKREASCGKQIEAQ